MKRSGGQVGQKGCGPCGKQRDKHSTGARELAFRECAVMRPPWKIVVAQAKCIIAIDVVTFFFCKGIQRHLHP